MRPEIERVIEGMRERYSEELPLAELAEMARLSPFHMARIFRQETGLPPGRFLAVVRLEEAKRKLLTSASSIADVSLQVGYSSVGTFTTRFTETVGVSPGRYRRISRLQSSTSPLQPRTDFPLGYGTVAGRTRLPDSKSVSPVFIAAFPSIFADTHPEFCRAEGGHGPWQIRDVPEGNWFICAVSADSGYGGDSVVAAFTGPVRVRHGEVAFVDLRLEPLHLLRLPAGLPPVLALPALLHGEGGPRSVALA